MANCKILQEMGILNNLTCLLRNQYASQEVTVRTGHGDFPDGPVVKTSSPNARGECLIPGQGAKIPHTSWAENQDMEQKQHCDKFNKDLKKKELDMDQWTGSKLRKESIQAIYCHPAYLTYMQSISCETLGWMKHMLESRLLGEVSITSDMWMTPPLR